jgi:hypothetical protein
MKYITLFIIFTTLSHISNAQWGEIFTVRQTASTLSPPKMVSDGVTCLVYPSSGSGPLFGSPTVPVNYTTSASEGWNSVEVRAQTILFEIYSRDNTIRLIDEFIENNGGNLTRFAIEKDWLGTDFEAEGRQYFIGNNAIGDIYGNASRILNLVFQTAPNPDVGSDDGFYGGILNSEPNINRDVIIYNFPVIIGKNQLTHRLHQTGDFDLWFLTRFDHNFTSPQASHVSTINFRPRFVAMRQEAGNWTTVASILPPNWQKPETAEWDSAIVPGVGPVVVYATFPQDRSQRYKEIWYSYFGGPNVGFVGPFQISSSSVLGDKRSPAVTVDSNNRVHVVWEQTSSTYESAIFYSSGRIGEPFLTPEQVSESPQFPAYKPNLIAYANGALEVVWVQLDGMINLQFDFDIFSRRRAPIAAGVQDTDAAVVK